ncbi:hypothetical protein CEXT_672991 [Caerostris extrusa]|uniref:Uncharacterized protein n=1 Tax=Caerostris extrusa TaxID=172846 RepID=A0AAV4WSD7_CAEEX|nr:hypothetical protein CEXT_672991 [Caerostris extrusa]
MHRFLDMGYCTDFKENKQASKEKEGTYQNSPCRRLPRDELPGPVFRFGHKSYFVSSDRRSPTCTPPLPGSATLTTFAPAPAPLFSLVPAAEESKRAPSQYDEQSRDESEHARQKETPPLALLHALLVSTQGARHIPVPQLRLHSRRRLFHHCLHDSPLKKDSLQRLGSEEDKKISRVISSFLFLEYSLGRILGAVFFQLY